MYFFKIYLDRFKKPKNTPPYRFRDSKCIGRECWMPGTRTLPAATISDRMFGAFLRQKPRKLNCCTFRFDHGCPLEDSYTKRLQDQRVDDGWRPTKI